MITEANEEKENELLDAIDAAPVGSFISISSNYLKYKINYLGY